MTEEGKLGTCWEQVVISRYSGSEWFAVFASIPKRHFLGFFSLEQVLVLSVSVDTERAKGK